MKRTLKVAWKVLKADPTVRKSTNALAVTLVSGIGLAWSDGNLESQEVGIALGAALVATAAVWKARNQPA